MPPRRVSRRVPVVVAVVAMAASAAVPSVAGAAPLYWDGTNTTTNADGGAGTWDATTPNWNTAAIGGANTSWSNSPADIAVFGGSAGTVGLGGNIIVGGLTFNTTGYVISNGGSTLNFNAVNNGVLLSNVAAATITGAVAGSGNFSLSTWNIITAPATLTLNGTSTGGWSGTTTINAGATLALAADNRALAGTSAVTLNGGNITLTNATAPEAAYDRVSNGAAITSNGGTFTWTNTAAAGRVYAETIGAVSLATGQTNFVLTTNQGSGGTPTNSQTLTLSGLARSSATGTAAVTFSSGSGLNTTTNQIVVTGASATGAGQIIGPWATVGTSATAQTDYAVYTAASQVVPAGIAASAETDWTTSGANVTLSGATSLTDNRNLNTLRYTGAAGTLGLAGSTLATSGILNGGSGLLTISGTGSLTTPSGGGNLFLTAGNNGMTISSAIADNAGVVTLVKNGSGLVLLNATDSSYSGGTVINAGQLRVASDAALGNASGSITLNGGTFLGNTTNPQSGNTGGVNITSTREVIVGPAGGAIGAHGNNNFTTTGRLSGGGTLTFADVGGAGGRALNFNATNNTFTGRLVILSNTMTLQVNSLADSAGAGNIALNLVGTANNGSVFAYGPGATTALTLNNRSIELNAAGTFGATINNLNTTHALTINTDLVATGAGAKTLTLGGSAGPTNVFAGDITNGTGGGTVALTKTGASTWTLSGDNSFSGGVTLNGGTAGSRLNIASATALGTGTFTVSGGDNASLNNTSGSDLTLATNNPQTWNNNFTFVGTRSLNLGTGAVTLGGNRSITVSASTLTVGGAISGSFGLTKAGAGTLELTGASSYTGATAVTAGTLLVNGSIGGTGVAASATGTLGGTGSITAPITVTGTARLAPGGSAIESLSATGLTMGSGTTFVYAAANAGATGADLMAVAGTLSLTGVLLDLSAADLAATTWAVNDKLTLISYQSAPIAAGFTGYLDDTAYEFGGNTWTINYNDTVAGGNFAADATGTSFVTLTATTIVPEPASLGLLALAGCGLLARRNRRSA